MNYKAIIFDFNGVLLWDAKWHEEAWNEISSFLRGRKFTKNEINQKLHGKTNREIISFLLEKKVQTDELAKLRNKKESLYKQIALSKGKQFKLSPGATKLLNTLKKNNIKRTIATSSPLTNVRFFFKHLDLGKWFDIKKVTYDITSRPSKPEPDIFIRAAKKLKVAPLDCVIVEDSKVGLEAARNAKAGKIIAVTGNNNTRHFKAGKVVTDLRQITLADFE
jgi:HAD superfamily hydrolase (TIGR01509 family)